MEEDDIEKKEKKSWKDEFLFIKKWFLNYFKVDKKLFKRPKHTKVGFSVLSLFYNKFDKTVTLYSAQSKKGRNIVILFIGNMLFLYSLHLFFKEMIISDEVYYGLKKYNFLFPNVDGAFKNAVVVKGEVVARESFFGVVWLWFSWVLYFTVDLILGIIIKKKELEAESKALIPFIKSADNRREMFKFLPVVCTFLVGLFFLDELLDSSGRGGGSTTVFMSILGLIFIGQGFIWGIILIVKLFIVDLIVVFIYYFLFLKKENKGVN